MNSKDPSPPGWTLRILKWFCPPPLLESIEGDLTEQFERDAAARGARWASLKLFMNVLTFFRPGILLRNRFTIHLMNTSIFGNYFIVAVRNLRKRKFYAIVNAIGLSIGIASCALIYLYVMDERSFDQFHEKKNNIYRINARSYDTWQQDPANPYMHQAWLQQALGPVLKSELSEVVASTRFNADYDAVLRYQDKTFTEKVAFVDADFFRMFSFRLLRGNKDKIFNVREEVVLTQDIASKYFGEEDPIGKTIRIDCEGDHVYTVSGLIETPPANSSLEFKVLLPQEQKPGYERNTAQWGNFGTPTFVELNPKADLSMFSEHLDQIVIKYMSDRLEKWRKRAEKPIPADVKMLEYTYTRLPDIHLMKEVSWHKVSDIRYSLILGAIAAFILLIACINYISLALTTSAARRTEVGIRKTVGAGRSQLVGQFGFESVLLAMVSMLFGLVLVQLFLPYFNKFTGKGMAIEAAFVPQYVMVVLALGLLVGCLAGSYPAFFLSRFHPVEVLKGRFTSRLQAGFTKPLVVLQFTMASVLIISAVIMYKQMRYITTKDLGFDKDQVVVIGTQTGWNPEADKRVESYRARLQQEPSVISVAGVTTSFNRGFSRYGYTIKGEQRSAYVYGVDPEYIPTMGIELVNGRNFDRSRISDTLGLIVNEALVRDMGWKDPLGEHLNWREDSLSIGSPIIGVVKDYHFLSLEKEIEPMFLSMNKKDVGYLTNILVKVKAGQLPETMDVLRKAWKDVAPDSPFESNFLDQDVARQYLTYERWMNIVGFATVFAILISCLGLFGLAGINAVNRTKEIGIRKVMGAGTSQIFILMNRQFAWLAVVAFVIAAPASWYLVNNWFLGKFQFKVDIGWELFAISAGGGLVVALVTVSYHAIKIALVNPADTLKYE